MVRWVDGFSERAERYADYFDLDEEMLRATDRFLSAWTNLLDPEGRHSRFLHQKASRSNSSLPLAGNGSIRRRSPQDQVSSVGVT